MQPATNAWRLARAGAFRRGVGSGVRSERTTSNVALTGPRSHSASNRGQNSDLAPISGSGAEIWARSQNSRTKTNRALTAASPGRIAALLQGPGPGTVPRIWRHLGRPQVSLRTLYRRVRRVAVWRRPKLIARGDPDHDHVVAGIVARLIELPRRAVVLAEDETHLNLLPHARAGWTPRGARPHIPAPGTNRQVTVYGAVEVTTGRWVP